jgi:hypothetical protein
MLLDRMCKIMRLQDLDNIEQANDWLDKPAGSC